MQKKRVIPIVLLALVMLMTGCSSDLASVSIKTNVSIVDVGDEIVLEVEGRTGFNTRIDLEAEANWSTNDGSIVSIDSYQAVFTPSKEGLATVNVTVGEFSDQISFTVGEQILVIRSLDFVAQGGGEVQTQTDRTYPCFSHWNDLGHWLEWEFEVSKSGEYTPLIMYSTGARYDVFRSVSIDGELVVE